MTWVKNKRCGTDPLLMASECRKSCGWCSDTECTDKTSTENCEELKANGQCKENKKAMSVVCAATCGFCQSPSKGISIK